MNTHHMRLQMGPFEKIKNGSKTIEVRLNDEKRRLIHVGDRIVFSLASDSSLVCEVVVTALLPYASFADLFSAYPTEVFGGKDMTENVALFYSKQDEERFGVLGIMVQRVDGGDHA